MLADININCIHGECIKLFKPIKMMRKLNLFILVTCFMSYSCNPVQELVIEEDIYQMPVNIESIKDQSIKDDFKNLYEGELIQSRTNLSFNIDDLYLINDDNGNEVILANQVGMNESNEDNYGLVAAYNSQGDLESTMIVRTITLSEKIFQIEYFSTSLTLLYSIKIDNENEELSTVYKYDGSNLRTDEEDEEDEDCGQDTMDCINDAYTNHGWISVGLWVQSIALPQTGVAIAVACAGRNCL